MVALGVGALLAAGGAWSAPGARAPFPAGGLVPALKPLYDDNWVVGFGVAQVLSYALAMVPAPTARSAWSAWSARTARHVARSAGLTR
jgi:hypothetical protein